MKIDTFTKILLLVIAIFLGILVLKPLVQVKTVQGGPGSFDYVKPIGVWKARPLFLDARNGDIWWYYEFGGSAIHLGRLIELGKPLVKKRK